MHFNVAYNLTLLLIIPLMAVQVRVFLYKARTSDNPRARLFADMLETIPHDLAIMGFTLGMAGVGFRTGGNAFDVHRETLLVTLVAPMLSLFLLTALPIVRRRSLRLLVGVSAYLIGAAVFVYAQQILRIAA